MRRLVGLVALLLVAGCASIPTSGPVTEVEDDSGLGQSTVRYSPALPADGAAPADIVRGYLDAMLAYPASTRTAAAFLTPAAARAWRPQAGVTVYSDAQVVVLSDGQQQPDDGQVDEAEASPEVPATIDEIGRLDARGAYTTGRGGRTVSYHLVQVDGQWRIDDPQPGLMVTEKFFADYFRAFSLYFFDGPATRLTSTPVHLPVDDRLAAALVSGLARRPATDGLRTFLPDADALRPAVPVDGGIAEVGFSSSGDGIDVDRLSAQIVWTLRQVPGLEGVRIGLGPDTLSPSGVNVQPLTAWQTYAPGTRSSGYALLGDQVQQLVGGDVRPISGPWGDDAQGSVGVALTTDDIAVVRPGRSVVGVGPRGAGAVAQEVAGTRFLDPVADTNGRFWLVDRPDGRVRVRVVDGDQPARTVDTSAVGRRDVRSFDVSPDGSRVVLTVGEGSSAQVLVAPIVRDEQDVETAIGEPAAVRLGIGGPRSAVWSDSVRVAFLAGPASTPQVHTALIDGSATAGGATGGRAALPDVDGVRLAVGDGTDVATYVTDRDGSLWHLGSTGSWRRVSTEGAVTSIGFGP